MKDPARRVTNNFRHQQEELRRAQKLLVDMGDALIDAAGKGKMEDIDALLDGPLLHKSHGDIIRKAIKAAAVNDHAAVLYKLIRAAKANDIGGWHNDYVMDHDVVAAAVQAVAVNAIDVLVDEGAPFPVDVLPDMVDIHKPDERHVYIAERLLQTGITITQWPCDGPSALWKAKRNRNHPVAKAILAHHRQSQPKRSLLSRFGFRRAGATPA